MKFHELIDELSSGKSITNDDLLDESTILKSVVPTEDNIELLCYVDINETDEDAVPAAFELEDFKRDDWKVYETK